MDIAFRRLKALVSLTLVDTLLWETMSRGLCLEVYQCILKLVLTPRLYYANEREERVNRILNVDYYKL